MKKLALFLLVPLGIVLLVLFVRPRSADKAKPEREIWSDLARSTSNLVALGRYDFVQKTGDMLLATVPRGEFASDYAQVALNCAKAKEKLSDGNPYFFYSRGEHALSLIVISTDQNDLVVGIAQGLFGAHSYRRALRLVNRVPSKSTESANLVKNLEVSLGVLREGFPPDVKESGSDIVSSELIDLLGVVPDTPQYDETSIVTQRLEAANTTKEPVTDSTSGEKGEDDQASDPPPKYAHPFLLSADEKLSQDPPDPTAVVSGPVPTKVVNISMSASVQVLGTELLDSGRRNDTELTKQLIQSLTSAVLPSVPLDENGRPPCESVTNRSLQLIGPVEVVLVESQDERCLFFLSFNNSTELTISEVTFPYPYNFTVEDVLGGETAQLVGRLREGSGGFLSATIIDPVGPRVIWDNGAFHFGQITFLKLRSHAPKDILVIEKSGTSRGLCEQCAAQFSVSLYRFNVASASFEPTAAQSTSYGEMNPSPTESRWGLGSANLLTIPDEHGETPLASVRRLSEKLRQTAPSDRTAALLATVDEAFANVNALLLESGQFLLDEQIHAALVSSLGTEGLDEGWRNLKVVAQTRRMVARLAVGEFQKGLDLSTESWISDDAKGCSRAGFLNAKAMLNQGLGRFNDAYTSFMTALTQARSASCTSAGIEGNLASYFRVIGDHRASYVHARAGLDELAKQHEKSPADMLNLATASFSMSREEEALDWIGEALRAARGYNQGGLGTRCLRTCGVHRSQARTAQDCCIAAGRGHMPCQ